MMHGTLRPTAHTSARRAERGFTLLLAAIVAAIVLALGSSIFVIAQKQIILSSISRDSQYAFYAADTGAECALYWDVRHGAFGPAAIAEAPRCDGEVLASAGGVPLNSQSRPSSPPYSLTFRVDLFDDTPSSRCVQVSVEKRLPTVEDRSTTVIRSNGYSTNCAALGTNIRALERTVELKY